MNVIINSDSEVLADRLSNALSVLADVQVTGVTKNLTEAEAAILKDNVKVLITAFHKIEKTDFKKLKDIKLRNINLVVIVLNSDSSDENLKKWRKTGADYVFDQRMHFNKVVDILSGIIYKNLLTILKSSQKIDHLIAKNKNDIQKLN
ncbi:MAG: hypothetical protein ACHQLA_00040 [Ignavibacteriales bacterium]